MCCVVFGMAKPEIDALTAAAENWGFALRNPSVDEKDEFAAIPGFHLVIESKPKTKFIKAETLQERTSRMIAALPQFQFDLFSIRKRKMMRKDLQTKKEDLISNFQAAVRALNQEQSVLDETKQTDENICLLKKEADTLEKLTDPVGRTARISALRRKNKEERAAFQAQNLIEQQESQWRAVGGNKRLKRNRFLDDEAEEAPPEEDEL